MESLPWKEYWNLLKGSLQRTYVNLTNEDLQYVDGKEDELMYRLQQKLGKSKDEINEILFIHLIGTDEEADEEEKDIEEIIDQIEKDMANDPDILKYK